MGVHMVSQRKFLFVSFDHFIKQTSKNVTDLGRGILQEYQDCRYVKEEKDREMG